MIDIFKTKEHSSELGKKIETMAIRKLKAQKSIQGIWFGFGMMGLVGWSIVIPTLLGIASGMWLDSRYPRTYSWTLTLLVVGLVIGCLNAWHWVDKENQDIQNDMEDDNE